jgi:hypothetical protein
MTTVQTPILERLGPMGPTEWQKNKKLVEISSLFSVDDILRDPKYVFKPELKDETRLDRLLGAASKHQQQNPLPAGPVSLGNSAVPVHQNDGNFSGILSAPTKAGQVANLAQSLQIQEPPPPALRNGENRVPSRDILNPSTVGQNLSLSQHQETNEEQQLKASVSSPRPSKRHRSSSSAEPRSALALSLD